MGATTARAALALNTSMETVTVRVSDTALGTRWLVEGLTATRNRKVLASLRSEQAADAVAGHLTVALRHLLAASDAIQADRRRAA